MAYVLLIALAVIFFRIGEHEYRGGWPLAGASLLASFIGSLFFPFYGIVGANIILFLGIIIYNLVSKRPPGSSSGL